MKLVGDEGTRLLKKMVLMTIPFVASLLAILNCLCQRLCNSLIHALGGVD